MQFMVSLRILGILLTVFSLTNLPPLFVGFYYHDGAEVPFVASMMLTMVTGVVMWLCCQKKRGELRTRDGFLIAVLFWVVLSLFGALPFIFSEQPQITFTDAVFEAVSGLTTTGSTVLTGLDDLPRSILYYRQQLQFLGGMGIIVLAVAILPMLGIGGMQLFRTEMTGPVKDNKLTPRITETAKTLWLLYVGLTVACGVSYYFCGMPPFDAICYAFSTVSTGGYATHDASFGYYASPLIDLVAIFFMITGAINFALHFTAFRSWSIKPYSRDRETRIYISILVVFTMLIYYMLSRIHYYGNHFDNFIQSFYHVVSLCTNTGFTMASFSEWPNFVPMLLLYGGIIGGCAGSTSGGLKVIRATLVCKQGLREIRRLIHPRAEYPLKFANQVVPPRVVDAVWGFIGIYLAIFVLLFLSLLATNLDLLTALSATMTSFSNTGPGLGEVALNFGSINSTAKWILSFAMLLGRLEIFTVLVLFVPSFWQR